MTSDADAGHMPVLSGARILALAMVLSAVLAATLSWSLIAGAVNVQNTRLDAISRQYLTILRENGVSGLAEAIDAMSRTPIRTDYGHEVALWHLRGDDWRLVRSSSAFADTLLDEPDAARRESPQGQAYKISAPDVSRLSVDWLWPADDVAFRVALPVPTQEVRAARLTVAAVWGGYLLALAIGLALHIDHRRRYTASIERMSAILDQFSAGQTHQRLETRRLVPELTGLSLRVNQTLARVEDLVAGLRSMVAHSAHELKTPLQKILADLGTIEPRPGAADGIRQTVTEANARLETLMQLFRLEAGADIDLTARVDLSRVVDLAIDDSMDAIETQGRTFTWDVAPDVFVTGNRMLLKLVLDNLLSNAAKYAPTGADVRVNLSRDGDSFRLSVANDGAFPPDIRDRAFDRFARARSENDVPGAGLGLSLVDLIARRHVFSVRLGDDLNRAEVILTGPVESGGKA